MASFYVWLREHHSEILGKGFDPKAPAQKMWNMIGDDVYQNVLKNIKEWRDAVPADAKQYIENLTLAKSFLETYLVHYQTKEWLDETTEAKPLDDRIKGKKTTVGEEIRAVAEKLKTASASYQKGIDQHIDAAMDSGAIGAIRRARSPKRQEPGENKPGDGQTLKVHTDPHRSKSPNRR